MFWSTDFRRDTPLIHLSKDWTFSKLYLTHYSNITICHPLSSAPSSHHSYQPGRVRAGMFPSSHMKQAIISFQNFAEAESQNSWRHFVLTALFNIYVYKDAHDWLFALIDRVEWVWHPTQRGWLILILAKDDCSITEIQTWNNRTND